MLEDPKTKEASGIEIKSSDNAMDRQTGRDARRQFAADRWINKKGGAGAIGKDAGLKIK